MKKILGLVLVLCLCLAGYAGAVVVEDWEGPEWSPGTSPGSLEVANGDTIPPVSNGWTTYAQYSGGAIGINNGVGYLDTVGAEAVVLPGGIFTHYGANVYKQMDSPFMSGQLTHYALLKLKPFTDSSWVGITMFEQNPNNQVRVAFYSGNPYTGALPYANLNAQKLIGSGGTIEQDNVATAGVQIVALGWIAAEITVTLNVGADNSVAARYRDVDDNAEGYIGDWISLGSITSPKVIPTGVIWSQGFYIGDFGNNLVNDVPFGWADRINDPIFEGVYRAADFDEDGDVDAFDFADWQADFPYPPAPEPTPEPATMLVLLSGALAAVIRRRR